MSARLHVLTALAAALCSAAVEAQTRPARPPSAPGMSASRSVMAGSMLSVFLSRMPADGRLAIARPGDPATSAIVVVVPGSTVPVMQTPGAPGAYELRLTVQKNGGPEILLRQPLATTQASATLGAPARIGRGKPLPVRGIGCNGEQDRVVLVRQGSAVDATGPSFFPAENVEATLEAPRDPGDYELRYVMSAPLSGMAILARQAITVE